MSLPDWLSFVEEQAGRRERAGLRRQLRPRPADDGLVDLAGNDYLGLAGHPEVLSAASAAVKEYGLGATSSRLVRGSTEVLRALEEALAGLLGCEEALVYSSGYLANLAAVRALVPPVRLIASDAHNHASLVDGCRLARGGRDGARTVVVDHADPDALAAALAAARPEGRGRHSSAAASGPAVTDRTGRGRAVADPALVVTESVFSVYGDLAPLARLHAVAHEHGAVLLVDDAHGVGVLGPHGAGGVAAAGLAGRPDVVVTATLSKAFGAAGGVVAGPALLIRHLVETSRTFIYDTGLAPGLAAGALAALRLIRGGSGTAARAELADRAADAHRRLARAGLDVPEPAGAVLSVAAPGAPAAAEWAARCRDRGVVVGCFRPPSTPDGRSWLRLTVNAGLPRADFDRAVGVIVAAAP